jgi:ABC-2 type transport system ATP-binding protein
VPNTVGASGRRPGSASDAILAIEGLVKDYGAVHAVRGISFEMRRGEVLGFLGPNGAGKSTTIRCVLDLLRPTAGHIRVFGLDPQHDGVAVRSRLTYVPGELRLPDRMTGAEMVGSLGRLRGSYDPRRRDELAERLKINLGRQMRELSSGNRRKLALLLAFLWPAELLVLDEPTTGLDPLMQHEFLLLVGEARESGTSVFLSSHVLSEVQRAADRVVVLRSGMVVAEGTVEELRSRARQRVEVWFERKVPPGLGRVEGLADGLADGRRYNAYLVGSIQPLLRFLATQPVVSMLVEEPDLEEAFLDLYQEAS